MTVVLILWKMIRCGARRTAMLVSLGVVASALMLASPAHRSASEHQFATAAEVTSTSVSPIVAQKTVSLRDRLIFGLQARLDIEVEYIDRVVEFVQKGQLPQRLVDETFFWARERASRPRDGRPRRPIVYFQPAMTLRAERIGVDL